LLQGDESDSKEGILSFLMKYLTRKWIKPEDLNPNGSLFGGSLLKWIDEEAAIYTVMMLQSSRRRKTVERGQGGPRSGETV
jgi:acyl-CoA hydrolase